MYDLFSLLTIHIEYPRTLKHDVLHLMNQRQTHENSFLLGKQQPIHIFIYTEFDSLPFENTKILIRRTGTPGVALNKASAPQKQPIAKCYNLIFIISMMKLYFIFNTILQRDKNASTHSK